MKLLKGVIMLFIYLFIDNTLLNKQNFYYNKIYNIKSEVCNNIYINKTPIINNNIINISNTLIKNNNIIENCHCIYINKIIEDINIYNILIYIYNKIIIFLGNILIMFIFIKTEDIKTKNLIFNKISLKINYDINLDICAICYTNYKLNSKIRKIIKCKHIYHEDCLKEWIIEYNKKTCPLCRCNIFL